jgi:hypothetical protein
MSAGGKANSCVTKSFGSRSLKPGEKRAKKNYTRTKSFLFLLLALAKTSQVLSGLETKTQDLRPGYLFKEIRVELQQKKKRRLAGPLATQRNRNRQALIGKLGAPNKKRLNALGITYEK